MCIRDRVADQVYFGDYKRDGDGGGFSSGYSQGGSAAGGWSAPASNSGYGAPPADGDQFADLSDDCLLYTSWRIVN